MKKHKVIKGCAAVATAAVAAAGAVAIADEPADAAVVGCHLQAFRASSNLENEVVRVCMSLDGVNYAASIEHVSGPHTYGRLSLWWEEGGLPTLLSTSTEHGLARGRLRTPDKALWGRGKFGVVWRYVGHDGNWANSRTTFVW